MLGSKHLYYQTLLLCLILLLPSNRLLAQNRILQSQYFSLNDGLSDRLVKDVLISKKGLVWIATDNGLNRFNGYDFLIFDNNPGRDNQYQISDNNIASLSEDRFDNIIIEYNSAAFFDILDPDSGQVKKVNLFPSIESIPRKIHVDRRGEIFAVAAGDSLTTVYQYTYDDAAPFKKRFSLKRNSSTNPFTVDILHLENGFFFINDSEMGLYLFDAAGVLMKTFQTEHMGCPSGEFLYPRKAYFLHQDKQSRVWLAFNSTPGLLLFDPVDLIFNKVEELPSDSYYAYLWEDQKGNLLFAQTNTGAFYPPVLQLDCLTTDGKYVDFSDLLEIGNFIICAGSQDFFTTIFFGIDTGLKVVQDNRSKVKTFLAKNLSADRRGLVMRGITGDQDGYVYFAKEDEQWYRLDLETDVLDTMMMVDYDTGEPIDYSCGLSLYYDGKGKLWGMSCKNNSVGQIISYDLENCMLHKTLYENQIRAYTVDSSGIFWLGTLPKDEKGELVAYDPNSGSFNAFKDKEGNNPFKNTIPRFILEAKNKILWVGTEGGLYRIDREQKTSKVYRMDAPPGQELSSNTVFVIYEAEDGKIWMGTANGLNILDPETGEVKIFDREKGLASNTVCGILPNEDGRYWISTYNGLSLFDPKKKVFPFLRFYQTDGFSHDEFNRFSYYMDKNGRCYMGSVNGINAFYADDLLVDKEVPPVILTKISRYDSEKEALINQETGLNLIDELVIKPNDTYFTLDFTLPVYRRSNRNQFIYFLEGYDKHWINNSNHHSIRFNRLPPGTYTLHVNGIDPNGNLSKKPFDLKIKVEQVVYKRNWFIFLGLVLLALILSFIYKYQLDQKLKVERLRTKLSSDLHDELSGLLTGIAMQTDIMSSITDNPSNKERLKKIGLDSRTSLSKMSDVIWSVDSRKDKVDDLIIRMEEHADEILLPVGIRYDVVVEKIDRQQKLPVDMRQDLYFIFKESINNVGKHSGASHVKIILRNTAQHFEMIIQDNGKGNHGLKTSTKSGQGISNLRMRAERLNAQLKLANEKGFTVSLKMRRFLKSI